ncbi:MAG: UDP-N-acetylmuramoyl-tripeptide--D-alanyl-D-alanine ligase [Sandaracinaceae bacterium]|nr:UDP-N-acetylmuramoyl-tripeptide--D-alanyl-D-alanine ligase [Sandaracinaceae bacterium]
MSGTPIPDNTARFSADELLAATSARGAFDAEVRGVSVDSRRVRPGELFVALRGETHDGHDHARAAAEAGAAALLVERPVEAPGAAVLEVPDTLAALGALAALHRRRFAIPCVGITGSVGKTTTKELVGAALRAIGHSPLVTRGNLNNRIGVPMTLLALEPSHTAAVIEMGMNEPGEIADLAAMAAPTIGIVTAVAEVHTEGVGSIEGVAREKGALLLALGPEGVAVYNGDDAPLAPYAERSAAGVKLSFGRAEGASARLVAHAVDQAGTSATISLDGRTIEVRLALLGAHAALDAAAALAAVVALEPARLDDAARGLADAAPAPHRMSPVRAGELLVIDDAYNASPRSMAAALSACAELARGRGGRLVAVLGDMLELGTREVALHREVGREVVRAGAHAFVACGERMTEAGRAALEAAGEGRGPRPKIVFVRDVDAAAGCVRDLAGPRDVVLVKGSRGMRMERVVAALEGEGV